MVGSEADAFGPGGTLNADLVRPDLVYGDVREVVDHVGGEVLGRVVELVKDLLLAGCGCDLPS
ncbi:hypothetical protein SAMN02927923_03834 [Microvirga guangxiensis]|uniref:Uncharacterized protein n=1 Tax=Microvirga guangxiensis TaxID=549386 RepID=A0A1G5L2L1_9HYPH|nr:hypothetical protein SAMN02927923_03834 [Microvirga guangxiensis]